MKREYDFSRAIRRQFFHKEAELILPVTRENHVPAEIVDGQIVALDRKTSKTQTEVWDTTERPRR